MNSGNRKFCLGMAIFFGVPGILILTTPFWFFGLLCCGFSIYYFYGYSLFRNEDKETETHEKQMREMYADANKTIRVPQNRDLVCEGNFYLWLENNAIKMFAAKWEAEFFKLRTIPVDNIIFYSREGEIHTETYGFGGGSSYSMVTGWNGKIDPIHISTELKDNRKTILMYKESGKDYALELGYADYLVLKKLIPQKDISIVTANKIENKNEGGLEEKIKALKNLYESGVISKSEFEAGKEKILQSL